MDSFQKIEQNLRRLVRQFYISALLKGLLMFLFVGLLFALFFLTVEHFLWLNSSKRTLLFWLIISFETVIFYGFILSPLFKLFKIQKGIDFEFASKIIGDHFPEIKDKLLNVLQLCWVFVINESKNQLRSLLEVKSLYWNRNSSPLFFLQVASNRRHYYCHFIQNMI